MKTATWYEARRQDYRHSPLEGEELTALALRAKEKRERSQNAERELRQIEEAMGGACAYHAGRLRRAAHLPYHDYEDLLQEGAISIIRSVDIYDETRGSGFRAFCYQRIGWDMIRALDELPYPRLPTGKRKEREQLASRVSLEAYEEEHGELGETDSYSTRSNLSEEDELDRVFREWYARHLLSEAENHPRYTERVRCIVERRWGFHDRRPYSLQELSDWLYLSRERVRQLEREGWSIIREVATMSPAYIRYRGIEARYNHIAEARATREALQENRRETRHLTLAEAYIAQRKKLQRRSLA